MANVLNYFDQADDTGDNVLNLNGTVLIGAAQFLSGTGAPSVAAPKGSLYMRLDGSTTNDRAYINTDGSTTWTALITAA